MALAMQVSMAVIVASCIVAIYMDPSDGDRGSEAISKDDTGPPYIADSVRVADFSYFGLMLSTALFSQLFQHSVPGLIRPLSSRNRKGPVVRKIFGGALILTTVMYIFLGLVATLYFGDRIESSINLNWDNFHWGYRNTDINGEISVPLWTRIINKAIVIVRNTLSLSLPLSLSLFLV